MLMFSSVRRRAGTCAVAMAIRNLESGDGDRLYGADEHTALSHVYLAVFL
jgi:hypothetical protein